MDINLKTLISKLNDTTRAAATRAASICMGLGQYEVDVEHLFLGLIEQPGSDLAAIARQCDISLTGLEADLRREVGRFATGSARTPVFSRHLPLLFEHGWLIASLAIGQNPGQPNRIRSAHLLLALLTEPSLAQLAQRASPLFARFPLDRLKHDLERLTRGSTEAPDLQAEEAVGAAGPDAASELSQAATRATPALDQYTTCLTARARDGKVDPVIGRDMEIRQAIDILMRRRQNNPILTGEAGVGKTAVVEGLALRIAHGDVPDVLKGVEIHTLDMGLLQAGASVKGEFENRLKNVIDEVKKSPHAIILFIDEAHTMIGAGGKAGQNDAANLLKPALARGELRTIAATTWGEYKKYFEKDAALARRFQVIKVEEPDEDTAAAMLRAMAPLMEEHFGVRVYDDAITEAVRLSHRYISGRQLPDKAISVLDTACAKVALGQSATPALLEDCVRRIERLDARISALNRDASAGSNHAEVLAALGQQRASAAAEQEMLQRRWEEEQALAGQIGKLRAELEASGSRDENSGAKDLRALNEALRALQGEAPLVSVQVDGHTVAEIVAAWTGIPLGRMVKDEIRTVVNLKSMLDERILGQGHASHVVAQRVRTARANLDDPNKPKGVFLFVGTSGVGKTETALALADILYGGERKLITINMSEYQEAHSVSGLKGSPPGYVGYGEGGVLTEAVRRNPYSVVLLDEAEKAHPDVLEMFFQVFDKGVMDDAEGRQIDFRNTIIILTSNAGSSQLMAACLNKAASELPTPEQLAELLRPALMKHFKPAFLGRLAVVPFYPIGDEVLANIIRLKLARIGARVLDNHKASFEYDDALVEAVLRRCTEVDSGARNVDNVLNGTLLPEIADNVLARMADGGGIARVKVGATKAGKFKYLIEAREAINA